MTAKRPPPRPLRGILMVAILLLAGLSLFFFLRAGQLQREYQVMLSTTPVPTKTPPDLAYRQLAPLYRVGSIGPEVIALQQRLHELGYYTTEIDGKYYEGTREAVRKFQVQHGLAADGIAGEITLSKLSGPDAQHYQPELHSPSPTSVPDGSYTTPSP